MKKSAIFVYLGYLYIIIPVIIFLLGFCNIPIAIISTSVICICSYFLFKNAPKLWVPSNSKERIKLLYLLLIAIVWVVVSGVGAITFQNPDHCVRNCIFEMLVENPWPVINENGGIALTYYIGFWLPAALIGKITKSIELGYFFQVVWASIGVFITFYLIFVCSKRKSLWIPFAFIFFSGLDILGSYLKIPNFKYVLLNHLEWWSKYYQFSSFTTQLFWVFNQAICGWILTLLLLCEKNNKSIICLCVPALLCSTFPVAGLSPFVFYFLLKNGDEQSKIFKPEHLKTAFKSALSIQNVLTALFIFPVLFLYFKGNISAAQTAYDVPNFNNALSYYLPFVLLEAGVFMIFIFKTNKKNPLYYICLVCFLLFPFIKIGSSADFCMRASIPALVILFVMIIQTLQDEDFRQKKLLFYGLILTLLIGSITPISEFSRTIILTKKGYTKANLHISLGNFFAYTKDNNFFKYLAKRK